MMQPACSASFASRSGVLHLYTDMALEAVINKISADRACGKVESFNIQQWAAFAKKKSNIASSICKELGRLKASQSVSRIPRGCDLDPLHQADPWAGACFGSSRYEHEDDEAPPQQSVPTAPSWQKFFSRPSEQDTEAMQFHQRTRLRELLFGRRL